VAYLFSYTGTDEGPRIILAPNIEDVNNVADPQGNAPQGNAGVVPAAQGDLVAGDAAEGAAVAGDAGVVVVAVEDEYRLSLGMLMHVKCIHDLCTLPLDIPPFCIIYWLYSCFLMIIGNNSYVPLFYRINLGKPENLFFNVFNFEGPKQSPNYLKLCGSQFSMEQDFGEKLVQQGSHKGQTSMAHMARFPGRVGPACSPLVAPMPSIFVSMDLS
jgi:hypothetical protein